MRSFTPCVDVWLLQAVQPYYEKIFDAISMVSHDPADPTTILEFVNKDGGAEERIGFATPVKAINNIEDWLSTLLLEMQKTMKLLCEECAFDVQVGVAVRCIHACHRNGWQSVAVLPSLCVGPVVAATRWCPTSRTSCESLWTSTARSTRCWVCSSCGPLTWSRRWTACGTKRASPS